MERYRLERKKWPLALVCAATAGLELALYLGVTHGAVAALGSGRALEGEWGWGAILGWHAVIALAGLGLSWQPLAELRTSFTAEGVRRPRLLRAPLLLRWDEAESVFVAPGVERPQSVRINAPGKSLEINALFYRNPGELLALIEGRMRACVPGSPAAGTSCPGLAAR